MHSLHLASECEFNQFHRRCSGPWVAQAMPSDLVFSAVHQRGILPQLIAMSASANAGIPVHVALPNALNEHRCEICKKSMTPAELAAAVTARLPSICAEAGSMRH